MMVPNSADREAQVEPTCDRTMLDVFRLPHRVKIVVLPDVSWPVSLAIQQPISLSAFLFISKAEDSYHLNIFGGPPVLPRVIGISTFLGGPSPIYQAGEVGHRSAEQRFVTVATFEHAHDSTLSPLIGKCTDILCETIEK
jgi:hypothetical protein